VTKNSRRLRVDMRGRDGEGGGEGLFAKLSVVLKGSKGDGEVGMCSRGLQAQILRQTLL
jgi:hypothetical protein